MNDLILKVLEETKRLSVEGVVTRHEDFEEFVELRQQLTDAVQESEVELTQEQRKLINEQLSYDSAILREMQRLKDEATDAVNRMNASKKQTAAYNNTGVYDSFMMDKRK